jgi:hypothetical protein
VLRHESATLVPASGGTTKRNAIRALVFDNWVAEAVSSETGSRWSKVRPKVTASSGRDGLGASVTRAPKRAIGLRSGQWKTSELGCGTPANVGGSKLALALVKQSSEGGVFVRAVSSERHQASDVRRTTVWCRSSRC